MRVSSENVTSCFYHQNFSQKIGDKNLPGECLLQFGLILVLLKTSLNLAILLEMNFNKKLYFLIAASFSRDKLCKSSSSYAFENGKERSFRLKN